MTVLPAPSNHTHELGTTRFTSLATPSRGTVETSIWRVEIAPRTPGTAHEVSREELFFVLAGRGRVRIADSTYDAGAGDTIVVPPHTPFDIANESDEPLEVICCQPVGGQAMLGDGQPFTPPWAE
jgi:mannose-6-phosphate isomerase-like protein (cupin superfamily)